MSILIDTATFNQMIQQDPYVKNLLESKNMKFSLLNDIKSFFSDKWDRLKNGTRSVLDMMAFLSTEKGFVYASQLYLADRYDVSDRTIRRVIKELEQAGLIYTVYRRHANGNSKGKPVYLFTNHPYFDHWATLLNIDVQEHVQEEKAESEGVSRDQEGNQVPTNIYQSKQESNINISNPSNQKIISFVTNRIQDSIKKGNKIQFLSSYINRIVDSLERQAIYDANLRHMKAQKQKQAQMSEMAQKLGLRKSPSPKVIYNWLDE